MSEASNCRCPVPTGNSSFRPLTIRSLLFGIAVALSYCFVATTLMVHHLWTASNKPCADTTASVCNRSLDGWILFSDSTNSSDDSRTAASVYLSDKDQRQQDGTRGVADRSLSDGANATEDQTSPAITGNGTDLGLCPEEPPNLVGRLRMAVIYRAVREHEIMSAYPDVKTGGHWKPPNCISRHKVALIIPYRDRKNHLDRLINFLIPIFQKQQLDFRIIVSEQYGNGLFNKGRVMNAAFRLAEKLNVDCVIFHDVDMFPENDHNPYTCPEQPRHLGAFVNVLKYELWYHYLLGGVVVIRMEHYRRINGHSNLFWGWGGEDDDFGRRVLANNMTIERPPKQFGKYTMLRHQKRKWAVRENINVLLNDTETRWLYDGVNDTQWSIVSLVPKPLYYHLHVDVGEPSKEWRYAMRP